ncbi:MAG: GntR family transcriptional regulator [Actinomycetota bacterium]|nr:GntR family transcriptional regulator [Actinomycetota bacterium]
MSTRQETPSGNLSTDVAYQSIRAKILSGELAGGAWLRENELANQLGVSRTPVREALGRLVADGLARHEPNRGVRVEEWTPRDLNEIYDLRVLLESHGTAMAALNPATDVVLLDKLASEMTLITEQRHPDFGRLTELNNNFHSTLLESSGNERLTTVVASIVQVPLVRQTFARYNQAELERSMAHHHEIVRAVEAGDAQWAEAIMRAHLRAGWSAMQRFLIASRPKGRTDGQADA